MSVFGVAMPWTVEQILALAPDASSAKSGKDLSAARKWNTLGANDVCAWGSIQGSGAKPYQTSIDFTGPAFKCTCPSRKFPCKHGLGLFLILAQQPAALTEKSPPAWVTEWIAKRVEKEEKKVARAAAPETPPGPEAAAKAATAAAKRAAAREGKVSAGMNDLAIWLSDLVRTGFATLPSKASSFWETPGYGRKRSSLREIVLCVDQSGSMATSVVYAGVFSAVLASLPSISTKMVVFDTAVVDLTEKLADPVDVLFGTQLGGGTDINLALTYCQSLIRQPQETILVLISDLYEGGNAQEMLKRVATLVGAGVQTICLLALNDDGAPMFDQNHAAAFATLGIPAFACTPDLFPDLMAAAIQRQDISRWVATQGITTQRAKK